MAIRSFDEMNRMFDEMDRMFNLRNAWNDPMGGLRGERMDAGTQLVEEDDRYVYVVDMPGFERQDIDLVYDDGMLKVSATHEADDDVSYRSRSVSKRVTIPGEIVVEEIQAQFRNGLLEVHLPRVEADLSEGTHIDISE
jgi:HSP20 family protein